MYVCVCVRGGVGGCVRVCVDWNPMFLTPLQFWLGHLSRFYLPKFQLDIIKLEQNLFMLGMCTS